MRRVLLGILLAAFVVLPLRARDKSPAQSDSPTAGEELKVLMTEFADAEKKFLGERNELATRLQTTKDGAERDALLKKLAAWQDRFAADRPITKFGPRFLRFAEKNSKDPVGVQALDFVLREEYRLNGAPKGASTLWEQTVAILQKSYVEVPEVKLVLPLLAHSGDPASEQFVRAVLEKNPERATQARAAQALVNASERAAAIAAQLKKDEELRKKLESQVGKEEVEKLIARGEQAQREGVKLKVLIRDKYADLIVNLSVGEKAPDVKGRDLKGNEMKLSDFRGKVVILDIWRTSCLPCRAMIPHQRALVKKLVGKPFVLISISADAEKESLTKFLDKEPMPWTHWWNGAKGGIMEQWDVQYFPTIYVIDAKGVIRHKDREGEFPIEKLEEAVKALLKEAEE
jgi:peroxiredoxin